MTRPNYYRTQVEVRLNPEVYHYLRADGVVVGELECFALIDALDLSFYAGNAMKYLFRAGKKSPDVAGDLRKAITYLEQELQRLPDAAE